MSNIYSRNGLKYLVKKETKLSISLVGKHTLDMQVVLKQVSGSNVVLLVKVCQGPLGWKQLKPQKSQDNA